MEARFEVVTLPTPAVPGMSIFACAQLTREAVWLPELLQHPNTARAIRKLSIAAPDPLQAAESWSRALAGSMCVPINGGAQIRIGRHALEFLDPATAVLRYGLAQPIECARAIAIEFGVRDVDVCREALLRGGLSPQRHGELITVGSEDAHGVFISFLPSRMPLV
jgi:hypothetical protein